MKKILFASLLTLSASFAGLIDGIAITVNDKPITLYDIDKIKDRFKYDSRKSAEFLIRRVLMEQELKKFDPTFDIEASITTEVTARAKNLNYSYDEFKRRLEDKGFSIDEYRDDIKTELLKMKFNEMIMEKRLVTLPKDSELQGFYNTNQNYFQKATSADVVEYVSQSEESLELIKTNPMARMADVKTNSRTISMIDNTPLANMLNDTKEGSFTKIIRLSKDRNEYAMIYVSKKNGLQTMPYEEAKNKIKEVLFAQKSQKAGDDYMQKVKDEADIKIVR